MIDFPVSVKLKSERIQDFRAYMIAGVKYSEAIGSKKNPPDIDPLDAVLRNKSGFGSYEVGLGCDIYFEFFKLSPEIKISNSFGNVLFPKIILIQHHQQIVVAYSHFSLIFE